MTFQSDIEPGVTGRVLRKFIESQGGVLDRQEGSHRFFVIDRPGHPTHGTKVPCVEDGKPASRNHVAAVAGCFGRDRGWLLDQLGIQRAKTGKVRKAPARRVTTGPTRGEVRERVASLRSDLAALEAEVARGGRDAEFYRQVFAAAATAARALGELAPFRRQEAS